MKMILVYVAALVLAVSYTASGIHLVDKKALLVREKRQLQVSLSGLPLSTLTPGDKNALVIGHNQLRATLGDLDELQMEWDEELGAMARAWSEECVYTEGSVNSVFYTDGVGQNINYRDASSTYSLQDITQEWWDEEPCPNPPSDPICTTNHSQYNQMAWDTTWLLGCEVTQCTPLYADATKTTTVHADAYFVVCYYYTPSTNDRVPATDDGLGGCTSTSCPGTHPICTGPGLCRQENNDDCVCNNWNDFECDPNAACDTQPSKDRTRLCEPDSCVLPETESASDNDCVTMPCGCNCNSWDAWGSCDNQCGQGTRYREGRDCIGLACTGPGNGPGTSTTESQSCEDLSCPCEPCASWTGWLPVPCSNLCGTGTQTNTGTGCSFCSSGTENAMTRTCEDNTCDPAYCGGVCGPWDTGSCRVTCDALQTRTCPPDSNCPRTNSATVECIGDLCVCECTWRDDTECSNECGAGTKTRTGTGCTGCASDPITETGVPCRGTTCAECDTVCTVDWGTCQADCTSTGTRRDCPDNSDCPSQPAPTKSCTGGLCRCQCAKWDDDKCSNECGTGTTISYGTGCTGCVSEPVTRTVSCTGTTCAECDTACRVVWGTCQADCTSTGMRENCPTNSDCPSQPAPTKSCIGDLCNCSGGVGIGWHWGPCSVACGKGHKCRRPPGSSAIETTPCVARDDPDCRGDPKE